MSPETNQNSVSIFGERLRREREMRGVSLDEIAEATKIGTRLLRALEEEQFDLLPGGIFNKGFVRAYAKYLGINEEQAVADYMAAAEEAQPDLQLLAQPYRVDTPAYAPAPEPGPGRSVVIAITILVAVVAAAIGGWKLYRQYVAEKRHAASTAVIQPDTGPSTVPTTASPSSSAPTTAQPVETNASATPTSVPVSPAGASPSTAVPATQPANSSNVTSTASGQPFEVVVHATGPAWVSIKADGKIAVRGIVQADQTKTIRANDEIVLWTGNAGSTQVTFQGQPVAISGGTNEVKLLVFKPNGLQPAKPRSPDSPAATEAEPKTQPQ